MIDDININNFKLYIGVTRTRSDALLLKPAYLIAGCAHLLCASANCSIRRSRDPEALDDGDRYLMQDPNGRQESGDHR